MEMRIQRNGRLPSGFQEGDEILQKFSFLRVVPGEGEN